MSRWSWLLVVLAICASVGACRDPRKHLVEDRSKTQDTDQRSDADEKSSFKIAHACENGTIVYVLSDGTLAVYQVGSDGVGYFLPLTSSMKAEDACTIRTS